MDRHDLPPLPGDVTIPDCVDFEALVGWRLWRVTLGRDEAELVVEAVYGSPRLNLPFEGLLLIGY